MYFVGIDLGSVSTDVVIINEKKEIVASSVVPSGASFRKAYEKGLAKALEAADIKQEDICKLISTGYGRNIVDIKHKALTEIKCHASGAFFLEPAIRTIIDIGGQDCKSITLDDKGNVTNFVMNDKCAAGTGRFIEVIARALDVELSEMGPASIRAKEACKISSICTVFAESEVISKLSDDIPTDNIIKGIHTSIVEKNLALLRRVEVKERIAITGGGAKNIGLIEILEERLNTKLVKFENPQIVGALGAAVQARLLYLKEKDTESATVYA